MFDFISKIRNKMMNNDVKEQPIKEQWKPQVGQAYWVVDYSGSIYVRTWQGKTLDLNYYLANNCFKNKKIAKEHKPYILERYSNILEEISNVNC